MKTIITTFVFCFICSISYAGVVEEAQTSINNEKHAVLVAQAKALLQEKASIEARLAEINTDLSTLQAGVIPSTIINTKGVVIATTPPDTFPR